MSCGELERLFLADAPAASARAHCEACAPCAALAADLERTEAIVSALRRPAPSQGFLAELRSIPSKTVSCEAADGLAAAALEGELPAAERARLEFHRSRCEACAEAAAVLGQVRELTPPAATPWLAGRIAAARRLRPRPPSIWRLVASPKAAIALAYAAAVVVMLSGFNPADLARKAGVGRIEESALASAQVAGRSLADRFGAFEEDALRKLAAWKGRAAGYGRAAISTAIQLVMRTEPQPPERRGKSGEDKGLLRTNEVGQPVWRA
jgi:hypothetical protein